MNKMEEAILDDKCEHESDKKETGICSARNSKGLGIIDPGTVAADTAHDKIFIAGPHNNDLTANSASCSLKELKPDQAQIEVESASNIGTSYDHHKEMIRIKKHEASGLVEVSAHEDSTLAKNGSNVKLASSSSSAECRDADLELDDAEDNTERINEQYTGFHILSKPCSGDVPSKDIGIMSKIGTAAVLQSQDFGNDETWQVNTETKNEPALFGSESACNANPRSLEKGKEKVLYVEDSGGVSKEREDSNESVESSSRSLASTQKRARSFNSKLSLGSKRSKKESNESSCLGSFLRKDKSFMNWISTITNGLSRNGQIAPSLGIVQKSSDGKKESMGPFPLTDDKSNSIACGTTGFNSIFQALYCPNVTAHSGASYHNNQREADALKKLEVMTEQLDHSNHVDSDSLKFNINITTTVTSQEMHNVSKELHVTGEPVAICSPHSVCNREGGKLDTVVSFSGERLEQGTYQVEFPSTTINLSSTSSTINEKIKQACTVSNIGSSSSSAKSGSGSPEDNGTGVPGSVPNSSSNKLFDNRSGFCQNLWITRLLPKASSPILNPVPCNLGAGATQNLKNESSMLSSHTQGKVAPTKEHKNSENCSLSYLETKTGARNGGMKPYPTCSTDSYGIKEPADHKLISKLSPIQPSQRLKNSESIASLFAKRLGALRHIMPPKISDGTSCAATICFFCGKTGHSVRECSELVESDLEDLLKYMNSQDGTDLPCGLCIRCFQLNHWAIACLHASSKGKHSSDNSFIVNNENSGKVDESHGRHSSANYDGRIILWSGDKQEHQQHVSMYQIPPIREPRVQTKLAVHGSSSVDEVAGPTTSGLYSKPVNKDLAERRIELKGRALKSEDHELKEKCVIPFCNFMAAEVGDEPTEIFETITLQHVDNEININVYQGTSFGNCLSISIRGSTCVVEYHAVSNHDFLEDELKDWWSSIMKGDGKLPSREELDKKLNERVVLGF
ncbi:serine-rich adhesin for platelets [Cocos nucifera]|uniref:Serine-rich adhesin for platelets n=1 Tax=Cocos nucifera TaxID=13894 RepID=A0A8K0ICV5_COCNU|nr:serine-rich adhesin for platelets [Cocos nucifera]